MLADIAELLHLKRQVSEQQLLARKPALNSFIETSLGALEKQAPPLQKPDISLLDALFGDTVLGA